jgi:hypothetical protein
MPDKRDMHKAKSHRNSNSKSHAQPAKPSSTPRPVEPSTVMTDLTEPAETPMQGKRNKSRR